MASGIQMIQGTSIAPEIIQQMRHAACGMRHAACGSGLSASAGLPRFQPLNKIMIISTKPIITIGVPVFNGSQTIEKALLSISSQSFKDFRVIISDNNSDDDTQEKCIEYIKSDSRFNYIRQSKSLTPLDNFRYILDRADTEFFVFLAADDYWSGNYLEININNMHHNKKAAASISKVAFVKNGFFVRESNGTRAILGTPVNKLKIYLSRATDNSRFYAVYKTDILKKGFKSAIPCHAADWYIMCMTIVLGDHLQTEGTYLYRDHEDGLKYIKSIEKDNEGHFLGNVLPLLPMSWLLFKNLPFLLFIRIFNKLLNLNKFMFKELVNYKHQFKILKKFKPFL